MLSADKSLDPRLETVILAEYKRRLREIGLYPASDNDIEDLGVHNVPNEPMTTKIGNIVWNVSEIESGRNYKVPTRVYNRVHLLHEHFSNVRYLWADEKYARGNFTPLQERQPAPIPARPVVQPTTQSALSLGRGTLTNRWRAFFRKLDPKLIAVLLTTHERGLWLCLGTWLEEDKY